MVLLPSLLQSSLTVNQSFAYSLVTFNQDDVSPDYVANKLRVLDTIIVISLIMVEHTCNTATITPTLSRVEIIIVFIMIS